MPLSITLGVPFQLGEHVNIWGSKVTICLGATKIALLSALVKRGGVRYGVRAGLLLYGGADIK